MLRARQLESSALRYAAEAAGGDADAVGKMIAE